MTCFPPGRYVRAEAQEGGGEPFVDKMKRLVVKLRMQHAEVEKRTQLSPANLKVLGHDR